MPNKDGTGPDGKGPKTGSGLGKGSSNDLNLDKDMKDVGDDDLKNFKSDESNKPMGKGNQK